MNTFFLYIHLIFLAIAVVGIAMADTAALGWMRGKIEVMSNRAVFNAHWVVTIGLSGLVLSGLYLFWPQREYLLLQPLFWIKMIFVVTLIINSFFIEALTHVAANQSFRSLNIKQKLPLFLSGGVSGVAWVGSVVIAYLLFGWPF